MFWQHLMGISIYENDQSLVLYLIQKERKLHLQNSESWLEQDMISLIQNSNMATFNMSKANDIDSLHYQCALYCIKRTKSLSSKLTELAKAAYWTRTRTCNFWSRIFKWLNKYNSMISFVWSLLCKKNQVSIFTLGKVCQIQTWHRSSHLVFFLWCQMDV